VTENLLKNQSSIVSKIYQFMRRGMTSGHWQ